MRPRLLDIVRCPACHARLELHAMAEERRPIADPAQQARCVGGPAAYEREVREGFLRCTGCPLVFPVVAGVPRLIRNAYDEYQEFFFRHREALGGLAGTEATLTRLGTVDPAIFDRRSNESFGRQWQEYQYGDRTWFKDDLALRKGEFLASNYETKQLYNRVLKLTKDQMEPHALECVEFARAVAEGAPSPVQAEQSLQVLSILDGIYRSQAEGREVAIEAPEVVA